VATIDPARRGASGGAGPSDAPASSAGAGAVAIATLVPAPAGLRPLTLSQYQDTLTDLLGELSLPVVQAETSSVAASLSGFSPLLVEQFETAALAAAEQAFTPERRGALVGCSPGTSADDVCVRQFLGKFGRRAFRRALEMPELEAYAALSAGAAAALGDAYAGLQAAVAAFLESPHFLYRVELGEPEPAAGFRYTSREMAARLAYLLWNASPDDDLLGAGERGDLVSDAGLSTALERALGDARSHRGVSRWLSDWLELDGLSTLQKDAVALPLMSDTLGAAFRTEITLKSEDLVFGRGADARELFTSQTTFVNAELARLYGLPAPAGSGFAAASLPADGPRAGLLGWGGILALHAKPKKTFPTSRGKFIRMALLCQTIPPPPPNVNTSLDLAAAGEVLTARQRLEHHRQNPACAGCHALTDPLGLALEHFDALGGYRADEDGLPIDTNGDLDGASFQDARSLGARLAERPETMGCLVRQLFRFGAGHVETVGEATAMTALEAGFVASGYRIKEALRQVVLSPAFRKASP
jgi:Protein of unknown function (DUF1588)/Protein of unknown function (DUF1592)/Protein of unknown function (DUF1595)/Protein of unknown function (DUF1585)